MCEGVLLGGPGKENLDNPRIQNAACTPIPPPPFTFGKTFLGEAIGQLLVKDSNNCPNQSGLHTLTTTP